jgi:hypothetical protein
VFSANPGAAPGSWDRYLIAARAYDADATVFDDTRDPPLSAYADLPQFVDVWSESGGSFEVQLDCY